MEDMPVDLYFGQSEMRVILAGHQYLGGLLMESEDEAMTRGRMC